MCLCECFINGIFANLSNHIVEVLESKDRVYIFIFLISLRTVTEIYLTKYFKQWGFPDDSVVRKFPAKTGDKGNLSSIPRLEDPLEEGMATHFSIFAWKISWTEEAGRLQFLGSQRVRHD